MSNQLPVYIQIHDQLKNEIEQGIWKVGDRLPSERELAVKFNVSRMTLRQEIQYLKDRFGYICCARKSTRKDVWRDKFYRNHGIAK